MKPIKANHTQIMKKFFRYSYTTYYKNQGSETTWGIGKLYLVHSYNFYTSSVYSFHQKAHIWRLAGFGSLELQISYGYAPMESYYLGLTNKVK